MELVGVDLLRTPRRCDRIGSKLTIPEEFLAINTNDAVVPPLFIVNCQIPSEFQSSLSSVFSTTEITDGPGFSLVYYFRVTPETASAIADLSTAPAAVKLFVQYCRHAPELDHEPTSSWKGRFKAMFRSENMAEFGFPSFITSYNAKPTLINRTGKLYRDTDPSNRFLEMDINLHKFAVVAKKGLQILLPYFEQMDVSCGFCIESLTDAEMPECLFGVAALTKLSYKIAPEWDSEADVLEKETGPN